MFKRTFVGTVVMMSFLIFVTQGTNADGGGEMKIRSNGFDYNQMINAKFSCDAEDVSPQLSFENVPSGTKSLALLVDDPDAPGGNFVHWLVYNIPADTKEIPEGGPLPEGSVEAVNDFGNKGYGGPCPPPGKPHRYFFTVYALDIRELQNVTKRNFEEKIKNHIIGSAELIGLYKR